MSKINDFDISFYQLFHCFVWLVSMYFDDSPDESNEYIESVSSLIIFSKIVILELKDHRNLRDSWIVPWILRYVEKIFIFNNKLKIQFISEHVLMLKNFELKHRCFFRHYLSITKILFRFLVELKNFDCRLLVNHGFHQIMF